MGENVTESFAVEGERLLAMIFVLNSEGFRINNLFQLLSPAGLWQANLTDGKLLWEFGRGDSPLSALQQARAKVHSTEGTPPLEGRPSEASPVRRAKKLSPLESILKLDLDL
jgi:hypothetical protein